jgi:hypothetical protein
MCGESATLVVVSTRSYLGLISCVLAQSQARRDSFLRMRTTTCTLLRGSRITHLFPGYPLAIAIILRIAHICSFFISFSRTASFFTLCFIFLLAFFFADLERLSSSVLSSSSFFPVSVTSFSFSAISCVPRFVSSGSAIASVVSYHLPCVLPLSTLGAIPEQLRCSLFRCARHGGEDAW